jgi:hypothetical protein
MTDIYGTKKAAFSEPMFIGFLGDRRDRNFGTSTGMQMQIETWVLPVMR